MGVPGAGPAAVAAFLRRAGRVRAAPGSRTCTAGHPRWAEQLAFRDALDATASWRASTRSLKRQERPRGLSAARGGVRGERPRRARRLAGLQLPRSHPGKPGASAGHPSDGTDKVAIPGWRDHGISSLPPVSGRGTTAPRLRFASARRREAYLEEAVGSCRHPRRPRPRGTFRTLGLLDTEYSMLDGAARFKDLFKEVKALGHDARGDDRPRQPVFGAAEAATGRPSNAGIAPVIGIEAYVAPERGTTIRQVMWGQPHQKKDDVARPRRLLHKTIWAQNKEGLLGTPRISPSRSFPPKAGSPSGPARTRSSSASTPSSLMQHPRPARRVRCRPSCGLASRKKRSRPPPSGATSSARRTISSS